MHVVLKALATSVALAVAWLFNHLVIKAILSPLRNLPGPVSRGLFSNHLLYVMDPHWSPAAHDQWTKRFGKNICIKGFNWFDNRLLTLDPRAVSYVLNHPADYEKPTPSRKLLSSLIGEGLLAAEGAHHRRQRKIMNPAFSAANLRALTPIFFQKAFELRDKWTSLITNATEGETFNITHWLSRATFDVIGVAGFGYEFHAIHEENEEVYLAYKVMFDQTVNKGQTLKSVALLYLPFLGVLFPDDDIRTITRSQATIRKAGRALVEKKKREFEDGNTESRDLLSLLVRSNMAEDVDSSQKITDEDISNQINTFLFAGSDTTSLGIAWCILLLAQHPEIQSKLRDELASLVRSQASTSDNDFANADFFALIDKLPFLENVCREILRLIPPVHSSIRVALKDDVIPISSPMTFEGKQSWRNEKAASVEGINIAKGEFIHVAIEGFNLAKDVWGDDAHEFNPSRWNNLPEAARASPGLYSNLMTFGAGPRACIGVRFSMIEMKVMLFVLLRAFDFSDPPAVRRMNVILTRPFVKGQYDKGSQLPILVTPLAESLVEA